MKMKAIAILFVLLILLVVGCTPVPLSPAPAPTPASFSLLNLTIQPVKAQPGEAVMITIDIANTGGTVGSYIVALMINGVKEADKSITVTAGGTQTVTFFVTNKGAASYNVVVDGLSGSFTVVAPTPAPVPLPVTPKKDQPFKWVSDITPGSGKGTPSPLVRPGDDGPWNHRTMSASSGDGFTWVKDNIIIADQASVPDAIVDKEGNIRVYYVDWYNGHRISVALSRDGINWIYKVVKIFGQVVRPGELDAPVDPDVVLLPDGKYRLYYMYKGAIYSAISDYGIDFTKEDGVSFKKKAVSGRIRMYYPKNEGTFTAFSRDGIAWVEEGLRLEGAWDPAVIRMQDGTYKMFYKIWIPPEKPPWLKP